MNCHANGFFTEDLYKTCNPPRHLEYRQLVLIRGDLPKDKIEDNNYLVEESLDKKNYKFVFNKYKLNALSAHGTQTIKIFEDLAEILYIYLKTHKKYFLVQKKLKN